MSNADQRLSPLDRANASETICPLADLKRRISDLGLTVESAIGFAEWIVDDDVQRTKGLERAKYEMDLVARIGGKRIAAPPAGATDKAGLGWRR